MTEISVIGGGISGLVAAITLAKAGKQVVVYEKNPQVGGRFNGDFQGLENWSASQDVLDWLRDMGLKINFAATPVHEATFFGPDGKARAIGGNEPLFYLVRRGQVANSLDQGLLAQALDLGVELQFGKKQEHVTGPAIIATGPRFGDGICVGYTFKTNLPDQAVCLLGNRLAPRGYSYLLVQAGHATLVSCQFAGFADWRKYLTNTIAAFKELEPRLDLQNARPFSGYGNVFSSPRLQEGEKLYVGEAAGLQDTLWGFGMRYAIRSAFLAAQSLLNDGSYSSLLAKELGSQHRVGFENRALLELSLGIFGESAYNWLLDRVARQNDPRAYLRKHYNPLRWKHSFYPLARLGMRFRSRYRQQSCHSPFCSCVWCACQRNESQIPC